MPEYYTEFCQVIGALNQAEENWLKWILKDTEEMTELEQEEWCCEMEDYTGLAEDDLKGNFLMDNWPYFEWRVAEVSSGKELIVPERPCL